MSKPQSRDEAREQNTILAWAHELPKLAKTAGIKPAMIRLSRARLEEGEEMQICVTGTDKKEQKQNYNALREALATMGASLPQPPLPIKKCSNSCLYHFRT